MFFYNFKTLKKLEKMAKSQILLNGNSVIDHDRHKFYRAYVFIDLKE